MLATTGDTRPTNFNVAEQLERVAELLEAEEENLFRVRSYRRAARELRALDRPVAELLDEGGEERFRRIPGVGERLAGVIAEIVESGHLRLLDRLETERAPEEAFERLPGIGEELAHRIHEVLAIETLEALEHAAYTGLLEEVEGIGPKRLEVLKAALAGLLGRTTRPRSRSRSDASATQRGAPPVSLLLEVDEEYRRKAEEDELPRIAPRRFNPQRRVWLPVMEVERDGWKIHALFSNTPRAHHLGRTRDWVVIYWERDGDRGQATVATAWSGPLVGSRVVRGREAECRECYGVSHR